METQVKTAECVLANLKYIFLDDIPDVDIFFFNNNSIDVYIFSVTNKQIISEESFIYFTKL